MSNRTDNRTWKEKLASMNRNTIGIVLCAAVAVLVLVIFLVSKGTSGTGSTNNKTEKKAEPTSQEDIYSQIGDSDLSGVSTDSKTDDKPWQELNDDEYSIGISVVDGGWTGDYMEDGSDESVKNVMALKFMNNGTQDIQYAEYVFNIGKETVSFKVSDLPAGQSCIALEANRKEFSKKDVLSMISRVVVKVDKIPMAQDQVLVVDNSDNTITIMNLTEKEIPVARVFYKTYDAKNKLFVGGITYTAKADKIPAGGGVTVTPEHFQSGKSVVLGTGVYKEES